MLKDERDKCGLCQGKGFLKSPHFTKVVVICPWCKGKKVHKSREPKPK